MSESYAVDSPKMPMRSKKPAKVLEHMRVAPAENGGATVEHHFTAYEHKPEMHVFGKGHAKEMAAHVMEHSGMKSAQLEEPEDGGEEEA